MTRLLQSTVAGLGQGSIYALLALAFVIIYKSTRVVNFALPGVMILGAYMVVYFGNVVDMNFWAALALAIVVSALVALIIERLAIRPMIGKPLFAIAIITLGLDIILRIIVSDLLGTNVRNIPDPWGLKTFRLGEVVVQERRVAMLVAAAIVVSLLFVFFRYSKLGLAMRATAFDQEAALAQGISVGTVFALSWAMAGGLAAVAGMFVGTGSGLDQQTAFVALKALPAVILGGIDSIQGAVIGALLIGLLEGYSNTYQAQYLSFLGQNFSQVVPYAVLFLVLIVRPYGLFGTPEIERV
jgi:branched-chain amino acid transport system permease protein